MDSTPTLSRFDDAYKTGSAPWVIGEPQPAIVELQRAGRIHSKVLDVGCGTGEHTILLTRLGYDVLGIDFAPHAIEQARANAAEKGVDARFEVADAMNLGDEPGYQTIVDSALFHTFDDDERLRYVASLASVTEHGGTVYVLCFSDDGPDTGPHPITQEELRAAFNPSTGWNVIAIGSDRVQTRFHDDSAPAALPPGPRPSE